MRSICLSLLLLTLPAAALTHPRGENPWAQVRSPVAELESQAPQVLGGYGLGCIANATRLVPSTPSWEVVNVRRHRNFGHPDMARFLHELGDWSVNQVHLGKIVVGDVSQPAGGPMTSGHASHETGLDVDIRYAFVPSGKSLSRQQREAYPAPRVVEHDIVHDRRGVQLRSGLILSKWRIEYARLIGSAAQQSQVERIFVSPPIKRELCRLHQPTAKNAVYPKWLKKVEPYYGHQDHFHVRLACPVSSPKCRPQAPVRTDADDPTGVGCDGSTLAWWFNDNPNQDSYAKAQLENPAGASISSTDKKTQEMPEECRQLLIHAADSKRMVSEVARPHRPTGNQVCREKFATCDPPKRWR